MPFKPLRVLVLAVLSATLLSSCFKKDQTVPAEAPAPDQSLSVAAGEYVTVAYTGSLKDGKVFDSTSMPGRTSISFQMGKSPFLKKLEESMVGMKAGESKTVVLEPKDAYGEKYSPFEYSKEVFEGKLSGAKIGDVVNLGGMEVKILKIGTKTVEVGVPSPEPLAGETLKYEVAVEKIGTP